jgi:hypothetical protein
LEVAQLAKFLVGCAVEASRDPTLLTKAHVESFPVWMIRDVLGGDRAEQAQRTSAVLPLPGRGGRDRRLSLERVRQPKTPEKLVPIMGDGDTKRVLDSTKGKTFAALRSVTPC